MADVKWIKITTDIFDDEKILLIESMPDAYAVITVWFKLLCMAGKQNNSGVFMLGKIAYTDKMLATIFRMKESTVKMALDIFQQFGMVEIIDGVITIPNWNKHQTLDAYEKKKVRDRLYQQERRAVQKALVSGASEKSSDSKTSTSSYVAVSDKEEEKEIDLEKEDIYISSAAKKQKRFIPPTKSDVEAYCLGRGNYVDAEKFVDYYTANGWKVGKNPMKDWQAAVRTWEKNSGGRDKKPALQEHSYKPGELRNLVDDPIERMLEEIAKKDT